jgi:hypothetical protein
MVFANVRTLLSLEFFKGLKLLIVIWVLTKFLFIYLHLAAHNLNLRLLKLLHLWLIALPLEIDGVLLISQQQKRLRQVNILINVDMVAELLRWIVVQLANLVLIR